MHQDGLSVPQGQAACYTEVHLLTEGKCSEISIGSATG